jgi:archaellum biogenesis ATPase FlaH
LRGKLENLTSLLEQEKITEGLRVCESYEGELASACKQEEVEDVMEYWEDFRTMLKEDILILLTYKSSSDDSALKEALLKLRNTTTFLRDNPRMERFGGSFKKIEELSDEDSLDLLESFLGYVCKMT